MARDPDRLTTGRARRGARMASGLSPDTARLISSVVTSAMRSPERTAEILTARHEQLADAAVEVLGSLRGGAMKVGQLASFVDIELLPEPYRDVYTERLAALRASAPAMSFARVRPVLEEEWEAPVESLFEHFEEDAAAAASVGQVHRATLPGGRRVAVKVQYPGVDEAIRADLQLASIGVHLARLIAPGVDPALVMAELRERILEELDYELEAQQQRFFARAYKGHPFILVPAVHTKLTRRRVLVSDWVDGDGFEAVCARDQAARDRVGEILFRFFMGSVHRLGRFQTDAHPGNYLVHEDGTVAMLDFGSVKVYPADELEVAMAGIQAIQVGDAEALRDILTRQGYLRPEDKLEAADLLAVTGAAAGWYMADGELRITREIVASSIAAVAEQGSRVRNLRSWTVPAGEVMFQRLHTGVLAVLGRLEASANWHRIAREWWYGEPPSTPLGELEQAFFGGPPARAAA